MGMIVTAYHPDVEPAQAAELGVEMRARLEDVLAAADFVSWRLPITSETGKPIDAHTLARFKKGAMLINALRGGLVDEQALQS